MTSLLLGSNNKGKLAELRELLQPLSVHLVGLGDLPQRPSEAPETGTTFRDNAIQKARHYALATGMTVIADDSGLCVDALGGAPGVHSARYSPEGDDQSNNARLLRALEGIPESQRQASYHAVIVVVSATEVLLEAEGCCRGLILTEPRGIGGFGYDPLFFVTELGKTFAEIPAAIKHRISHRGQALRQIINEWPRIQPALGKS
jgi:XTP/dITP diphosphohydrolase